MFIRLTGSWLPRSFTRRRRCYLELQSLQQNIRCTLPIWHAHLKSAVLNLYGYLNTHISRQAAAVPGLAEKPCDQLSGGRFIFVIGGGWNAEEMGNHGADFKKRWRVLRERVLAMKEIWTKEEAEFHGEFVNFDKIWSYPKPVRIKAMESYIS
ncbi:MAG: hypothetical protein C4291_04475 [Candidatus Dadabacteria bacterium]